MGSAVQTLREEAGLTQEELAARFDSDFPTVGSLERGTANPTYSSLLRLAGGLEIDLSVLIKRSEEARSAGQGD